jgi:sporulation protein YlmC with PRC-barrel domain
MQTFEQNLQELTGEDGKLDVLPSRTLTAELFQGSSVYSPTGAEVGEIDDIVIDLRTGRVTHVFVSRGEWLEDAAIAIAWQDLQFDATGACSLAREIGEWHE